MILIMNLALFVPFFLVLLIVGIIYLVSGYKKDFGRSLVSVCATIVSVLVSMLLAKLLAGIFAKVLISKIPGALLTELGALGGFASAIVGGMLQIILAFVLFSTFFIIFLIVFKSVAKRIKLGKLERLNFGTKQSKIGGMAIRAVDAFIVSMFLLMPIYGGIGAVVPTVAKVVRMTGVKDGQVAEVLQALEKHPVLAMYQYGPTSWVSSGLSTFEMNGKSVNVAKVADSMEGVMARIEKFSKAKGEEKIQAYKELNTYIRENVIEEKWCYDTVMAFLKEFEKQGAQDADMAEAVKIVKPLLKMSYADFKKTGIAISEFTDYALESNFVDINKTGDYTELPEDFAKRFGKLLNQSDQLISVKKMILQSSVEEVFRSNMDADADSTKAEAAKFVEKYYGSGKVAEELQTKEADAFVILLLGGDELNVLEALARHPLFGAQVAADQLTKEIICDAYRNADAEEVEALLERNPSLISTLKNKLKTYGSSPLQQETFSKYVNKTLNEKLGR